MTGVAAHAFLEPYIGVSATKVTNKLHPATLPTLPRPISRDHTYPFPHSYALFPHNLRIPVNIPTHPPSRTHAPSLAHPRILSYPVGGVRRHDSILSHAPTYPLSRTYASSLTHLRILSHAPTHPPSRTNVSLPPLTGRRPIAYTYSIPHFHEYPY